MLELHDVSHVYANGTRALDHVMLVLKFVTGRKPSHVGLDPYNFYIDRDSADKVVPAA